MRILKLSLIVWLMVLSTFANAFENYDECGDFQRLIKENIGLSGIDNNYPIEIINNFGFEFSLVDEGEVPLEIDSIYTQTRLNYDFSTDDYDAILENDLFKINKKLVENMDYDQFLKETSGETIELEVFDYDKTFEFSKSDYNVLEVLLTPVVQSIYDIDPKHARFGSKFSLKTTWEDNRLLAIAEEIYQKGLESDPDYNNDPYLGVGVFGYFCNLTAEFMTDIRIMFPEIEVKGFRSEVDPEPATFIFNYYPEDNSEVHSADISSKQNFQGYISQKFKLKKFPFDEQYLDIEFGPKNNNHASELTMSLFITAEGSEAIHTAVYEFENNSWKATDYFNGPTNYWSDAALARVNSYEISLLLQRNIEYYIFKLMLPILLLLALTWSIFWIDLKDLETRITISIVTFLALIAYNFVIDNDLAKLAYLTFLDSIILVSYLFAGLPTFMAIYCKKQLVAGHDEWSKKINSLSRVGFPLTYILSVGFLMIAFQIFF